MYDPVGRLNTLGKGFLAYAWASLLFAVFLNYLLNIIFFFLQEGLKNSVQQRIET